MVMGELDASDARRLRAHTETCRACATELAMLTAERALFARRAEALDALDPPPALTSPLRATAAASAPIAQSAEPHRRLLPALGRIAMRGHFSAACAAALFVVAALSRLGTATVSLSISDDVAAMSARRDDGATASESLASFREGEPLTCSFAGSASGATMQDDGATTSSWSAASRGELLACVGGTPDIAIGGGTCEPSVTCSALRQ